jgi:hypothetical protein
MKNLVILILMKAVRMVFLDRQSEFQTFSKKTFRKGMTLKLFYFGLGKLGHRGCPHPPNTESSIPELVEGENSISVIVCEAKSLFYIIGPSYFVPLFQDEVTTAQP